MSIGRRTVHDANHRLLHRLSALLRQGVAHVRLDGVNVAAAFLWRLLAARLLPPPRDPGERAAERFLRALGYAIIARNWRSPRDPRDEADLIALTPDRREIVIVEVKRAAGPWDALGRVDGRKKEVLWRLLTDVERCARGIDASVVRTLPASAVRSAEHVRVDLIGVRGEGRSASVVDHDCGLFLRALRSNRATRAP